MYENIRIFGMVSAVALLVTGCYDAEVHYEQAIIEESVASIVVDVGSGDVTLSGSDASGATVRARVEGSSNHLLHALEGGRLTLFDDCNDAPCSIDLDVVVPYEAAVALRTGSGDIHVERLLDAIMLRTGSGDITGSRLVGGDLDAETGSGDVVLEVGGEIGVVRVNTGSGDVGLDVPEGYYRLDVSTGSGDRAVHGVGSAADAPGSIEVHTGSGDVVIRGR